MNDNYQEIWLSHSSIEEWRDVSAWSSYLSEVEVILGAKLTHLDDRDPVRKKVSSLDEAAKFICSFEEKHESRWLFGKFGKTGISFQIKHHRQVKDIPNNMKLYFPAKYLDTEDNAKRLKGLFKWGNQFFSSFWGWTDLLEHQVTRKRQNRGAANIQRELLGVHWLNYFNSAYVDFFGRDKFDSFPEVIVEKDGGITTCLGVTPSIVPTHLREELVTVLGKDSFINPEDILTKPEGKFALSFEQLREAGKNKTAVAC
jgi:hypothetical protein